MGQRTIVPFGPQHPVLPEPIHLDLVLEDERVVEAVPSIGYIHRGLERLCEKKDIHQMVMIAERICGICSCIHGQGYCQGVEELLGIEAPPRAKYLRVMWGEMSRVHSHLLWMGLAADAFGFESLFMHTWRLREKLLDVVETTGGGRVIFGVNKIGGVRRDVSPEQLATAAKVMGELEAEFRDLAKVFEKDASVQKRLRGIGYVSKDDAVLLGAQGPMLRASGVEWDARKIGYAAYKDLTWSPAVRSEGDCWARTMVRVDEMYQSFSLIQQSIAKAPEGPVEVKALGNPKGEFFSRLEQPRGEVVYYLKGNGTKFLERFRVRTPTFANIPPLVAALKNCELADVPTIVLTIDPCISCTER